MDQRFLWEKPSHDIVVAADILHWNTQRKDFPDGEEIGEDNVRFFEEKERLLVAERDILRVINFDLDIDLPYDHLRKITPELFGNGLTARNVKQVRRASHVKSFHVCG